MRVFNQKLNLGKTLLVVLPLLFITSVLATAEDKTADLAVVVNESSLMDDVSSADLAKIFKMEKIKSPGGFKFIVAMRDSGSPERRAALTGIYHMTDAEYKKFFLQATFTGSIQSEPRELTRVASVKEFIASSPGAIGYLRGTDVDDSVKVLKVDGKLPGEPGYPLKIR